MRPGTRLVPEYSESSGATGEPAQAAATEAAAYTSRMNLVCGAVGPYSATASSWSAITIAQRCTVASSASNSMCISSARAAMPMIETSSRLEAIDLMVGNISADLNSHGKHGSGRRFLSGGVDHGGRQPEIEGGRLRRQNDRQENQCHRPRAGQSTLDVQGVSTSSRKTAVRNEGEQLSPDAPCVRRTLPRGSESSHITPAHPALICPSRHRR